MDKENRGKKLASISMLILGILIVIGIIFAMISKKVELPGGILGIWLVLMIIGPLVSLVLSIVAVSINACAKTIISLVLAILFIVIEIVFVAFLFWAIASVCGLATDSLGILQSCGDIG